MELPKLHYIKMMKDGVEETRPIVCIDKTCYLLTEVVGRSIKCTKDGCEFIIEKGKKHPYLTVSSTAFVAIIVAIIQNLDKILPWLDFFTKK